MDNVFFLIVLFLLFISFIGVFKPNFMYVLLILMSFVFFLTAFTQSKLIGGIYFAVAVLFYIAALINKRVYAEEMKAIKQEEQEKLDKYLANKKNYNEERKSA